MVERIGGEAEDQSRPVFTQELIDAVVARMKRGDFVSFGQTLRIVREAGHVFVLGEDGVVRMALTDKQWSEYISDDSAARRRHGAALARDFWKRGLHGGFW